LKQNHRLVFTRPEFNNITIINRKVVSILQVKVEIPLVNHLVNQELENIEFLSSSPELIHLCIYQHPMRLEARYGDWEEVIFKAIIEDKNLDDIDMGTFQSWNIGSISLFFSKWKNCNAIDAKSYIYLQKEKLFETGGGKQVQEFNRYRSIANEKKYLTY
jgi:hypothetical protein